MPRILYQCNRFVQGAEERLHGGPQKSAGDPQQSIRRANALNYYMQVGLHVIYGSQKVSLPSKKRGTDLVDSMRSF